MGLHEEIQYKYTDEDGLILEKPNSSSGPDTGNGILNYCVYIQLLSIRGKLKDQDFEKFRNVIFSCQIQRGLYNRGPRKKGDLEGHDDYVALAAVSAVHSWPYAEDIAIYGSRHFWDFNNVDPGKWNWKAMELRFIWFVSFWRIAGGMPQFYDPLIVSLYLAFCGGDESNRIQQWLMTCALQHKLPIFDWAIKKWRKNLLRLYKNGMEDVFFRYYGPSHPFTKYTPMF